VELDGNPWFIAKDVASHIGYRQAGDAVRILFPDEKGTHQVRTPGGPQFMSIISESGLYKLIMRSDKPQARECQDWVTRVVLPTIRKEGVYVAGEENIGKGTPEDDDALILRAMKLMEAKIEKLKAEREQALMERDEAIETKDALKESVGTYLHTVRDYVRMLDHRINLGCADLGGPRLLPQPLCQLLPRPSWGEGRPRPHRHHQG